MKRSVKFSKNLILRDFTDLTWSEPEILGPRLWQPVHPQTQVGNLRFCLTDIGHWPFGNLGDWAFGNSDLAERQIGLSK